jgi:hypothetical protein
MLRVQRWRHCAAGDALLHVASGADSVAAEAGDLEYEGALHRHEPTQG